MVKDNVLVLIVISGYDEKDGIFLGVLVFDFVEGLTGDIKGMKIVLFKEYLGEGVVFGVKEVVLKVVEIFCLLGVVVEEVSLFYLKYGVVVYYIIVLLEVSFNL